MGPSDEELVARVAQHDNRHAFAVLVRRHQSDIRSSLRRLTRGDEALADDLAQETFTRAYRSIRHFRGVASFRTWLFRIAYRCFLSDRRRPREDADEIAEHHAITRDATEAHDFMADFELAMRELSPAQRDAVHFSLQRGFAHPEIAEIMGLPLGTVKTHVLRGRQKLQELLADWREGFADD